MLEGETRERRAEQVLPATAGEQERDDRRGGRDAPGSELVDEAGELAARLDDLARSGAQLGEPRRAEAPPPGEQPLDLVERRLEIDRHLGRREPPEREGVEGPPGEVGEGPGALRARPAAVGVLEHRPYARADSPVGARRQQIAEPRRRGRAHSDQEPEAAAPAENRAPASTAPPRRGPPHSRAGGVGLAPMKILYGVVGEGMGHAMRSRVVLEHLVAQGHEVEIMASGARGRLPREALRGRAPHPRPAHHLRGEPRPAAARRSGRTCSPGAAGVPKNIAAYFELIDDFRPRW